MTNNDALLDAYIEMIEIRVIAGYEPYLLSLMFNPLPGGPAAKQRQMERICEGVYNRILTRLVKRPKNKDTTNLPVWISCPDWPVQHLDGWSVADSQINGGMHMHAIVLVPPNARTGRRLSDIINGRQYTFLAGPGMPLQRLHVVPITETAAKTAGYALKSLDRRRVEVDGIVVLPRSRSEL
ncbi:hypothetical protein [Rhizobium sp. PAMB 3182]